ncbi:glucose/galactose transporter [Sulfurimonas gotlandica GD1]|uniref:Glucose/galactose transporter n=1 Tax=Sulfurimonas gotlandica (strain DSM 19862 / JCM 16533 / GD1) TaxID=929558 RepID=H1FYC9_SULGG|nr:sugar MFS transporter [Sulfurimonas gotlandica]EHP29555.1 glucose/galactose transporter [Sulfurimonas gotlandica GD1]
MRRNHTNSFAMIIIGILFFIFGFVTWLNGSLIPFLKVICDLNEFQALFVTFAFYIAYTVMALPMAHVLEKTGYKNGMVIGLAVMAVGSLLFIPAALSANFIIFLVALFTLGTGLTILQTASNPYVVLIGPLESAAMRISIMGLINKSAGVLVPILFTSLILSDITSFSSENLALVDTKELASRLIAPYLIMAMVLIGLMIFVKFSFIPELEFEKEDSYDKDTIFHFPRVVLGAVALFFYVGIEVIAGDTIGLYAQGLGVENATALTSYTMVFMVFGYLVGVAFIPKLLSQEKALIGSALVGILFLLGVAYSSNTSHEISEILWGWSSIPTLPDTVTFVALLGFANALVWPTIWPLALEGLGKYTAQGSALLIMAIAGGAILPLAFGKVAQITGDMQSAYLVGIVCYFFIFMYAIFWHKKSSW